MDDPARPPSPPSGPAEELEALLAEPGRWPGLDPEKLAHLLFYQCLSYGLQPDEEKIPALMALHRAGVERLHPASRRQLVVRLARAIERVHREHELREGAGCTNGLLPFLLDDPDPSVVSSAASEMALLLPLENGDPLTGPRYVRTLIDEVAGEDARAGIVAGLLQLGDERVGPLVAGAWRLLGDEGRQTLALLVQAFKGVHALLVEFLVSWLEDEAAAPQAAAFGMVAATLARAGRHASEHGVTEVRRKFPVSEAPAGEPYEEVRELQVEALAPALGERLGRLARAERPPRLMPHVLSYWGFDLAAYRSSAEAAVGAAAADPVTGLCEPQRMDLLPDWPESPEEETLLEWGIFNPIGPTINTLRLTPVQDAAALVYTLYHPTGSVSRVMGCLSRDAAPSEVCLLVRRVMARNGHANVWLLRSLPDYVHLPAASVIGPGEAAEAVGAARRAAIAAGEERMGLRWHAGRLRRLAADPWGTTRGEMQQGRAADAGGAALTRAAMAAEGDEEGADLDAYRTWLETAAAPGHVAALRAAIPEAWHEEPTEGDQEA